MGGAVALHTYNDDVRKNVDERVARAFEMNERFDSPEFRRLRTEVDKAGKMGLYCSRENRSEFRVSNQDLYAFVGFFDVAQICIEEGLCDERTSTRLFEPFANGYYSGLKKFIDSVRAAERADDYPKSMEFAVGLQALARHPARGPNCSISDSLEHPPAKLERITS